MTLLKALVSIFCALSCAMFSASATAANPGVSQKSPANDVSFIDSKSKFVDSKGKTTFVDSKGNNHPY